MEKYIKEIVYSDNSKTVLPEIVPLVERNNDEKYVEFYKRELAYNKQFKEFHNEILEHLISDFIKKYAINYLDLIDEDDLDDVKEKIIDDFNDDELIKECQKRGFFYNEKPNIINAELLKRFSLILNKENNILLDKILTDIENKLGL
jgi:hypothetical protein